MTCRAEPHGLSGRIFRRSLWPTGRPGSTARQTHAGGRPSGGAGTDATRVSSFNPWSSFYWLVSGRTIGGRTLYPKWLDRQKALELYTHSSAWFSSEQGRKGRIKTGELADCVALSAYYLSFPKEEIKFLESALTIVDGRVVYAAQEFKALDPPELPVAPDWSPAAKFPGHFQPQSPAVPP